MRISVLINNYNYQDYVVNAIESVLIQSYPVDEIIVVDDKSTDNSVQILQELFTNHEKVKLVIKDKNEGQLSSFNEGFLASRGDIICFLDADDLYKDNYIAEVVSFYQENPKCDFLYCSAEVFGKEERIASCYENNRDLGYSKIATFYKKVWIGHRTSTLSMRRNVLEKFLPIPFLEDWRVRADDCIIFGASIAGARKFYLAQPLVRYRAHGNNNHYGRKEKRTPEYLERYNQAITRLFSFLWEKMNYPSNLDEFAHLEFKTIPQPNEEEFQIYKSIVKQSQLPKWKKAINLFSLYTHLLSKSYLKSH
ncbi:MAG: glycosyltransferase family 2 protein [Nostocales cyanobacterium 94392]|nr:glycosyltransferase family 2 protein [Nostocales cyanobacterium 94392]